MVYFIFSQGFRLGGHNSQRAAATGLVPLRYDSDRLNNFEAGLKSTWFDRRMQLNLSAFYMEWKDIQIDNAGGVDDVWWLRYCDRGDGDEDRAMAPPQYDPETLLAADAEDERVARQGYLRGLCALSERVVAAGSSPATVSVHDLAANVRIGSVSLSRAWIRCATEPAGDLRARP